LSRDIVTFKDTTVSRRHFEIILTAPGQYSIRDLASAGGTFIRVLYGQRKELIQGMIIMLGKHQFVVSSICSSGDTELHGTNFHRRVDGSEGAEEKEAERSSAVASAKKDFYDGCAGCKDSNDSVTGKEEDNESLETCSTPDHSPKRFNRTNPSSKAQTPAGLFFDTRCCVITCCAPEGSPLVGRTFTVGSSGGVLGRSPTCAVPLCRFVDENEKEDPSHAAAVSKLDSAISAEHARIVMDHATGKVFLLDGTSSKPSTNGTWFRLSGPAQESVPFSLTAGDEVLFGTKRFQVSESMTVSEEVVVEGP
jgi:pSer/pThr/pTyr-binding forkhead associated (FHA) protein